MTVVDGYLVLGSWLARGNVIHHGMQPYLLLVPILHWHYPVTCVVASSHTLCYLLLDYPPTYIVVCSRTPCYLLLALPSNLRNGTAMQ